MLRERNHKICMRQNKVSSFEDIHVLIPKRVDMLIYMAKGILKMWFQVKDFELESPS